jgi:AraC family transcriptional regulator
MDRPPFSYLETHRVARQPGSQVNYSSEDTGWPSLFACICSESAYGGSFAAVKDHLVVIPLNKPVRFTRRICGELQEQILLPGSATITPGGADFSTRTSSDGGQYDTLHFYIRDELFGKIRDETFALGPAIALPPWVAVMDEMLRALANEIRKMLLAPFPGDALCAETLSRAAAGHLLRHYVSERNVSAKPGQLTSEQCRRAIEYIEERAGASSQSALEKIGSYNWRTLNDNARRKIEDDGR